MYQHFVLYICKQAILACNNLSFFVTELIPGMSLTLNKPLRHRMATTDAFKRAIQHQGTVLTRGSKAQLPRNAEKFDPSTIRHSSHTGLTTVFANSVGLHKVEKLSHCQCQDFEYIGPKMPVNHISNTNYIVSLRRWTETMTTSPTLFPIHWFVKCPPKKHDQRVQKQLPNSMDIPRKQKLCHVLTNPAS